MQEARLQTGGALFPPFKTPIAHLKVGKNLISARAKTAKPQDYNHQKNERESNGCIRYWKNKIKNSF